MSVRDASPESARVLDFQGFPGRWEILETGEETNGERFKTRMVIREESELPPHVHPGATESYEVVSGELDVMVDGEWSVLGPGEKREVPPGTEHSFRTSSEVEVINVHSPAQNFETFFRRFQALKVDRGVSMPPSGFKSTVLLAMLLVEHEDEQVATSPPQWAFRILARIGSMLGYELPE